jgi:pimeloyl-ACP methyl ester carboxylesterase
MKTIILLHGAIGAASQLQPLADALSTHYHVHSLNFDGHGGEPLPQAFSIAHFATQTVQWLQAHQLQSVTIVGYSMGGYVALYMARHWPQLVGRIATLGTKFHWDEPTAARETQMLIPEKIIQKLPAFAQTLQQRHAPQNWKEVLSHTAAMMHHMGAHPPLTTDDYPHITCPTLLMLGDRDKMVTTAETLNVYSHLPQAQLAILPGTPHPIEQVDAALVSYMVQRFCN